MIEDCSSLDDLLQPTPVAEFIRDYWEQEYLYVPRNREGHFDCLFSIDDVDRWLSSTRSGDPDSVLVTPPEGADSGKPDAGMRRYRPRDVPIDHLYEVFAKGHSLVLNHLEDSWVPVSSLVRMLARNFCANVGVNVYLTPRGARTFPIHIDDHDVFVLQVYGEKLWQLHERNQLPVMRLEYGKDLLFPADWKPSNLNAPMVAELLLRPGDVLYIPRGMPHCAVTKDKPSLHLTLSITPLYWTDFLKIAVEQACLSVPELRRALPPGFINDPEAPEAMSEVFKRAISLFNEHASFDATFETARRNCVRSLGFPPDGHFSQLSGLSEITVDSEVAMRENILCSVEISADQASNIRFGTRHVRGPKHLLRAMMYIRDQKRFRIGELPGLDDQSKLVLIRRLIKEGLLRVTTSTRVAAAKLEAVLESA